MRTLRLTTLLSGKLMKRLRRVDEVCAVNAHTDAINLSFMQATEKPCVVADAARLARAQPSLA